MGLFFKKHNNIINEPQIINKQEEIDLFPEEEVELIDGQIMKISENGVLDTNSYKAIEIYKHNLNLLVKDALEKGYVDKFFLIREDNYFPKNFEWAVMSDETSFESTNTQLSYQIRVALAEKLAGGYKSFNGVAIPPAREKVDECLSHMDKKLGNLYLPSHFRSTKHFTVNTPLELTGDYNNVSINRNFIVIDDINNFLKSGYGYSLYYKDAYLDVSHEPLKISDKAVILIEDSKYDEIMKNEEVKNELAGKNVIRYKGDTAIAINMVLTEMGALPSKISHKYVEHDSSIYQLLDDSLRKVANDNHLQFDREHYGNNGHFSGYYDDKNRTMYEYIDEFCNFLRIKFPEHSNLFVSELFSLNLDLRNANARSSSINYVTSRLNEIINTVGAEELLNAINEFNQIMHAREKSNYQEYLDKQKTITPEISEAFKRTCKLVNYYYDNKLNMGFDNATSDEIDRCILVFLHSKNLDMQYKASCYLNAFIEHKMLDNSQNMQENEMTKLK